MFKTMFAFLFIIAVLAGAAVVFYNIALTETIYVEVFGRTLYSCAIVPEGVPYIREIIFGNPVRCPLF